MATNSNGNWQPQNLRQRTRAELMMPPMEGAPRFNSAGQEIGTTGGLIPGGRTRPIGPLDPALTQSGGAPEPAGYSDPTSQRMQRALAITSGVQPSLAETATGARASYDQGRDSATNINPFLPTANTPPEKAANDLAYLDKLALHRAGMGPRPGAPIGPMDPAVTMGATGTPMPAQAPGANGPMALGSMTPAKPSFVGPLDPARPAESAAMPRDYFPAIRGTDARGNPTLTQSPESLMAAAQGRDGNGGNATVQQLASAERNARIPGFNTFAEAVASLPVGTKAQIQQNSTTGKYVVQGQLGGEDGEPGPNSSLAKMQADLAAAEKSGRPDDAAALRAKIQQEMTTEEKPFTVREFQSQPELMKQYKLSYTAYRKDFERLKSEAATLPANAAKPAAAAASAADKYVVGKTYKDGKGNTATYLGNGKWDSKK